MASSSSGAIAVASVDRDRAETAAPIPPSRRATDARRLERRQVYLGEGLVVRLEGEGGIDVSGEVVDLTPEGLGVAVAGTTPALPRKGDVVTVRHEGRALSGVCHRARITSVSEGTFVGQRRPRIGMAFVRDETTTRSGPDRRRTDRYECSESLPATASAVSPLFFREWMHFRIHEIGAGGTTLSTSLRNKGLLPGMELDLRVTLPIAGVFDVRGRIATIGRELTGDRFRVGVRWIEPSRELLAGIAEYVLLDHRELSPSSLREGGLPVGSVERAVRYDYARPDEHEAILDLRLRSHRHEGRLHDLDLEDLKSPFDDRARHLVCRFGSRIVAYVRVIYVEGDPANSQYATVGKHVIPEWLWREGFVEAGAGATDPEFQRAGLFVPLMQHAARVALQSGARYMLGGCDDDLLDMYRQMGFVPLETRFVEPKPGWRFRSHLIVLDLKNLPEDGKFVPAMSSVVDFVKGP